MIKEGLIGEFLMETENTRKLLNAIPNSVLEYRAQPFLWSLAELAAHISNIYTWYPPVYQQDFLDLATFKEEQGDLSSIEAICEQFERNAALAKQTLETSDEATYFNDWSLKSGEHTIIGPVKKIAAIRGFLCSHLYHHRGEMVAYLRVNGCKVPGLYGPSYEESHP